MRYLFNIRKNNMITQQNLEKFKNKLEEEKRGLISEIERLKKIADFGDDIDSLDEEADETEEYGNQLAVAQDLKNRLVDIDSALLKINPPSGGSEYGMCEKCKKETSLEVLEVDPESRLCKNCKRLSINSKAAGK